MSDLPAVPNTILDLLEFRKQILEKIKQIAQLDEEICSLAHKAEIHEIWTFYLQNAETRKIDDEKEKLDLAFWCLAFEKLQITNVMSQNARDKFLKDLEEKTIEFVPEKIEELRQNAVQLFKDSSLNTVKEVYKQLISCEYGTWKQPKKDNLQKVEPLFRTTGSDVYYQGPRWKGDTGEFKYIQERRHGLHFNDLLTACFLLEGRGVPNYSNNFYAVSQPQLKNDNGIIVTDYFTIKAYKNGNCKVTWNPEKMDVLDKLNRIGSEEETTLPDSMRKRYKREHFNTRPLAEDVFGNGENAKTVSKNDFGFFPTPPDIAARMVELADMDPEKLDYGSTILEPSAGDGAIVKAFPPSQITRRTFLVERSEERYKKLIQTYPHANVFHDDFLTWNPKMDFDRAIMNPPFGLGVEAYHIVRAFSMLKKGGKLVTILPESWFFKVDEKSKIFREFMERHNMKSEKLHSGEFKESGTTINTRIVVLDKK